MRRAPILRALAAVALAVIGCTNAGENRVTGLSGAGMVDGFLLVDANGSRVLDAGDDSFPGRQVRLVLSGRADTGLLQTTQPTGFFRFTGVPVGAYSLKVDTTGFADTLQIVKVDSASFTVGAGDSVRVNALVGLPLLTVRQARVAALGRRVFVTGVALSASSAFADSTTSIADTSGSIRVARARSAFAAGDSIRLLGTIGTRAGEPSLDDPSVFAVGSGRVPNATALTTAAAATGGAGGVRDAQLVSVHGAIVTDTSRTANSYLLTANDSSGPVTVELDFTADPAFQAASLPGPYVPGSKFDIVGVLTPTGAGSWRLRPRSAGDLTNIPLPVISIRAARAESAGQIVNVIGVALNGTGTFADTSVFIADTSGAIRLTRLRTTVAAGDSIKVRATTSSRGGEPTLDGGTSTALGTGFVPTAATLTTAVAATAAGGARDAQLVIVNGAVVSDTSRAPNSYLLTASDGSGTLTVELDFTADPAFQTANLPGVYVPGNKFDLIGILVPTGTGTWRLRPRSAADLTNIPLPVISIRAARLLAAGQTAVVVGVALNGSGTFSDTTVFLADTSGAIRLTRLRANLTAGDSVRIRATTSTRSGEPTLDGGTSTALGQGFYPPAPKLTSAVAATAAAGARDAQLVVVDSVTISDTATVLGDFRLHVTDGSGALEVLLDHTAGFTVPGTYVPGNVFNIVGILVPTGTGSWILKPRIVRRPPEALEGGDGFAGFACVGRVLSARTPGRRLEGQSQTMAVGVPGGREPRVHLPRHPRADVGPRYRDLPVVPAVRRIRAGRLHRERHSLCPGRRGPPSSRDSGPGKVIGGLFLLSADNGTAATLDSGARVNARRYPVQHAGSIGGRGTRLLVAAAPAFCARRDRGCRSAAGGHRVWRRGTAPALPGRGLLRRVGRLPELLRALRRPSAERRHRRHADPVADAPRPEAGACAPAERRYVAGPSHRGPRPAAADPALRHRG